MTQRRAPSDAMPASLGVAESLHFTPEEIEQFLSAKEDPEAASSASPVTDASHSNSDDATAKRLRRTEIERMSRRRRQAALRSMRDEVKCLEEQFSSIMAGHAVRKMYAEATTALPYLPQSQPQPVVSYVDDVFKMEPSPEAEPEDLKYSNRIQTLREGFVELKLHEDELKDERQGLEHALRGKELLALSVRSLTTSSVRGWYGSMEEESAASPVVITSLSHEEYHAAMQKALGKIKAYDAIQTFRSSGSNCLGWTDHRHEEDYFWVFSLTKRFEGRDPGPIADETWEVFSDEEKLRQSFGMWGTTVQLRVLEKINDDAIVLHRTSNHPRCRSTKIHVAYLLFRVKTDDGITICMRSQHGMMDTPLEPPHRWTGIFAWIHLRQPPDSPRACEVVYANYIPDKRKKCEKAKKQGQQRRSHCDRSADGKPRNRRRWTPDEAFISFVSTVIRWEMACVSSRLLLPSD